MRRMVRLRTPFVGGCSGCVIYDGCIKKSAGYPADFLGQCKTYVTDKRTVHQYSEPYVRTSSKNALKVLEGVLGGHFFQEVSL